MMRGVKLDDPLRTLRLVDWYYEEKRQEFLSTLLIATAAFQNSEGFKETLENYRQSIWPTEKTNKEWLNKNKEWLEEISKTPLEVRPKE